MSELKSLLDAHVLSKNTNSGLFDAPDPLQVATKFKEPNIALICALFAYGNAKMIVKFLNSLEFSLLDESEQNIKKNLSNFKTLTSQAEDGVRRQKALLSFLKNLYLEATPKNGYIFENRYNEYLSIKKEEIQNELPLKDIDNLLASSIVTVLAILNIPPIESKQIPLAHYTSSTVCNKLFNILSNENNEIPQMRIGSSTYMNDPSEGKGLLELLNIPEWKLENKTDCSTVVTHSTNPVQAKVAKKA